MEATELTWAGRIMLQARREDVKHVIRRKFGEVPPDVEAAIDTANTDDELIAFLDRAVTAKPLDDLLPSSLTELCMEMCLRFLDADDGARRHLAQPQQRYDELVQADTMQ